MKNKLLMSTAFVVGFILAGVQTSSATQTYTDDQIGKMPGTTLKTALKTMNTAVKTLTASTHDITSEMLAKSSPNTITEIRNSVKERVGSYLDGRFAGNGNILHAPVAAFVAAGAILAASPASQTKNEFIAKIHTVIDAAPVNAIVFPAGTLRPAQMRKIELSVEEQIIPPVEAYVGRLLGAGAPNAQLVTAAAGANGVVVETQLLIEAAAAETGDHARFATADAAAAAWLVFAPGDFGGAKAAARIVLEGNDIQAPAMGMVAPLVGHPLPAQPSSYLTDAMAATLRAGAHAGGGAVHAQTAQAIADKIRDDNLANITTLYPADNTRDSFSNTLRAVIAKED